ncbi:catalase family peroxidase [Massilia sp. YIM B04103]|uniref:catalase family peroxidase n=1 Tax=Massilia sp. YIM B04103 TaxID=2963106 RepID=UPI00210BFE63
MNKDKLYDDMLDALTASFGSHEGFRVSHAKGIVALGTFVAAPGAATITRAPHFQASPVPLQLRFSNFSGVPTTPDGDSMANPRGLALRFQLEDGSSHDIVAHSHDGFPAGSPEEFLGFLQAIAASVAPQPDAERLERFLEQHPRAKAYLEAPKPAPKSYLSEHYFGLNAFRFINEAGELRHGRYRIDPLAPAPHLTDAEALAMPPDFLSAELAQRLDAGAGLMRLMLQLAAPGDVLDDCSLVWPRSGPEARQEIMLGTIRVEALAADAAAQPALQRSLGFSPGGAIDGIEASDDPLIPLRRELYARAMQRRQRAAA